MLELRAKTYEETAAAPVSRRGLGAVTLAVLILVAGAMAYVGLNASRVPEPMRVAAAIPVAADENVIFADGSVWALTLEGEGEGITRVDPATNRVLFSFAGTETRNIYGGGREAALGPSGLWVSNPIATSAPDGWEGEPRPNIQVVYEDWTPRTTDLNVAETSGAILRFDPQTGEQLAGMLFIDHTPGPIAVTPEGVWTTTERGIALIDPDTLRVSVFVGGGALLAVGNDAVWAAGDTTVTKIDPAAREVVAAITVTEDPDEHIRDLAVDGDDVWVTTDRGVVRIRGSRVVARVPIEDPWGIAAADGHVVVTGFRSGTLSHIDAATNRVDETIDLSAHLGTDEILTEVAIGAGSAWLAGEDLLRIDLPG